MLYLPENLKKYRIKKNLTQEEVAVFLGITPQSVSKWERGESLPDIVVLKTVADLLEVTLDYLVEEEHEGKPVTKEMLDKNYRRNCYIITGTSIFIVALMATLIFVILAMIFPGTSYPWLCYAYSVPVALIVWLVFNSIWFNPRKNFMIVSLMVWSLLLALYMTFSMLGFYIWPILLVGIPAQMIIVVWSKLKNKNKE
jgi:transcriptional regulator with XRE-family HTH domain